MDLAFDRFQLSHNFTIEDISIFKGKSYRFYEIVSISQLNNLTYCNGHIYIMFYLI